MSNLVLFFKGILIGFAKVIPGVSGSLFAVSLGVYNRGIKVLSNPIKAIKNDFNFIFYLSLGVVLAIGFGSGIIGYFLKLYPLYTTLLFIGFIMGTFPSLFKEVNVNSYKDYFLIFSGFIILLFITNLNGQDNFIFDGTIKTYFMVFLFGVIDAATMIIPGISGTAIFMLIGCYKFVLNLFSSILNVSVFSIYLLPFIIFFLGLLCGSIGISKVMSFVLDHYYKKTYLLIISFAMSSIFMLFMSLYTSINSLSQILLSLIFVFVGFVFSFILNK